MGRKELLLHRFYHVSHSGRCRAQRGAICHGRKLKLCPSGTKTPSAAEQGDGQGNRDVFFLSYKEMRVWIRGVFLINGDEACFSSWVMCSAKYIKLDQI